MLYRSGYSYKDPGQECILALSVRKEVFVELLESVVVASSYTLDKPEVKGNEGLPRVRVQWDHGRTARLERLPYRSIQIEVPGALVNETLCTCISFRYTSAKHSAAVSNSSRNKVPYK